MGYHEPKRKKIRPQFRGEVWELWDGAHVTVLQHLSAKVVEVMNGQGKLEAIYEERFYKRLAPPMPQIVDGVGPESKPNNG